MVEDARANEEYTGAACNAPWQSSGVKTLSPLSFLPFFDMCWDFLPDVMHITTGVWYRHIWKLMLGLRTPAPPRKRKDARAFEDLERRHRQVVEEMKLWEINETTKRKLDERSRSLGGQSGWVRSNIEIGTKASLLNSHDWMTILQSAGHYVLQGVLGEDTAISRAIAGLLDSCNKCINITSPAESENRSEIDLVKQGMIEALCEIENVIPKTELSIVLHILVHCPDSIYRWGSLRNGWSFFGERLVGWVIRHIHNRDLAAENIVTALVRRLFVFAMPVTAVTTLKKKLQEHGIVLPDHSLLVSVGSILNRKGTAPGMFGVNLKPSRRNCKTVLLSTEERRQVTALCASYPLVPRPDVACTTWKRMSAGVKLNGRPYTAGSICEYMGRINRHQHRNAGDLSHRKIGLICSFLVSPDDGPSRSTSVFVLVRPQVVHGLYKNMYILDKDTSTQSLDDTNCKMLYIDSISAKIHVVPHYDEDNTSQVCGIRMWESL